MRIVVFLVFPHKAKNIPGYSSWTSQCVQTGKKWVHLKNLFSAVSKIKLWHHQWACHVLSCENKCEEVDKYVLTSSHFGSDFKSKVLRLKNEARSRTVSVRKHYVRAWKTWNIIVVCLILSLEHYVWCMPDHILWPIHGQPGCQSWLRYWTNTAVSYVMSSLTATDAWASFS